MNKRRKVLGSLSTIAVASAAGIPLSAFAQKQAEQQTEKQAEKPAGKQAPKLDENDPQAVSLGYKHDTTKVDKNKFPKHDVSQICSNCQFYQGTASDPWAPCSIFGGKQVANKGWCSAWVKKTT